MLPTSMKIGQVVGIGIDIVNISRFKRPQLSKGSKLLSKIFTKLELDYCFSKKNAASSLATKYVGKEAIVKAFGSIDISNLDYKQIEIFHNSLGAPKVNLKQDYMKKYKIIISLSNELDKAVGVAIIYAKR